MKTITSARKTTKMRPSKESSEGSESGPAQVMRGEGGELEEEAEQD